MIRANKMATLKASGVHKRSQSGVEKLVSMRKDDRVEPYIAEVTAVYSERGTCDIQSAITGQKIFDVPVTLKVGLIDDEVFGELDLPAVGNRVMVKFIENRESMPYIDTAIVPFLNPNYSESQHTTVNSASKAYTLKLLETGKENTYRKIFKSGTTFEVGDDGTVTLETPSGTYVLLDEDNGIIKVEDQHGNVFTVDSNGVQITDANANKITMDNVGMKLEDKNGRDITMTSTSVKINGTNFEVLL